VNAELATMSSSRGSALRVWALARAEGLLLRRNRLALLNALAVPVALVYALTAAPGVADAGGSRGAGAVLLTGLVASALLIAVYYNLVAALVARREQLVLKRLRTGESTDTEILVGTAAPAIAVAWGQIALAAVAAAAVFGMAPPANAALMLVALVCGTVVFVLLAAVSSAVTRTVEMAQVTTLPMLMISFAFSGLLFPLTGLREPLRSAARALPLTSVVDLMRLGLTGTAADGHHLGLGATFSAASVPVLVLAAWIAVGAWAARRWFRWEPRR
jgi:ABC-2 type transport system permease protein